MLTITVSIWRSRFGLLIALMVLSSSTPVGFRDLGVVMTVVGIFGDAELGAQLRHAIVFHFNRRLVLSRRAEFEHRAISDLDHRSVALAAQFGELLFQGAIELVRRVVAVKGKRGVLR